MEAAVINKLDSATLEIMQYNDVIALIGFVILVITIIYSFKKDGVREVIENIFLWFLLFGGIANISFYPVDSDDEITAGLFFVAFGVCRMAKNIAKKYSL